MDAVKRQATTAQVAALVEYMQEHSDVAKGLVHSGLVREDLEAQWRDLTSALNSMGGAVKSVDKWKQTWRDLKSNTRKRAQKQQQSLCDTSQNLDTQTDTMADEDNYIPPKKKYASFDEEIIRIEKEKLELEREYKTQKIKALSSYKQANRPPDGRRVLSPITSTLQFNKNAELQLHCHCKRTKYVMAHTYNVTDYLILYYFMDEMINWK